MAKNLQQLYDQNESAKRRLKHRIEAEKKGMAQIKSAIILLVCLAVAFFVLTSGLKAQTILYVTIGMLAVVLFLLLGDVLWRMVLRDAISGGSRESHMISEEEGSPDGENVNYDIVVENWNWKFIDGFAVVAGRLRNESNRDFPYLLAQVRFVDAGKKKLSDTSALISKFSLSPGEEATFQIIAPKLTGMDQALLYFTQFENDAFVRSKSLKSAEDALEKRRLAKEEANKKAQEEVNKLRVAQGHKPRALHKAQDIEKKKINPFMNK